MTLYLDSKMPFGKYQGKVVSSISKDYLKWINQNTEHKVLWTRKPKEVEVSLEKRFLTFYQMEDLHRRTCAKIGRQLIYENVQIPF